MECTCEVYSSGDGNCARCNPINPEQVIGLIKFKEETNNKIKKLENIINKLETNIMNLERSIRSIKNKLST